LSQRGICRKIFPILTNRSSILKLLLKSTKYPVFTLVYAGFYCLERP
jgi:hypothetical protein